ncbi:MAG: hypothetical protein IT161_01240 [Bryobacterales bacterium]|nr:hypothetical protein [Bryobacterales bacterium]
MEKRLALIHTSPVLVPMFDALCREKLSGMERFHVVDESLIRNTISAGALEKITIRRLVAHIGSAFEAGATAVFVTCSSIGPGVAVARQLFDQPVFRVDEAMAARAVAMGRRIGVLATLRTTLQPTARLIEQTGADSGAGCEVTASLCEGAFEAVLSGDGARHDELVRKSLTSLAGHVDVIVLAQASMARVLDSRPHGALSVPVLSSPALAVEQIREALGPDRS